MGASGSIDISQSTKLKSLGIHGQFITCSREPGGAAYLESIVKREKDRLKDLEREKERAREMPVHVSREKERIKELERIKAEKEKNRQLLLDKEKEVAARIPEEFKNAIYSLRVWDCATGVMQKEIPFPNSTSAAALLPLMEVASGASAGSGPPKPSSRVLYQELVRNKPGRVLLWDLNNPSEKPIHVALSHDGPVNWMYDVSSRGFALISISSTYNVIYAVCTQTGRVVDFIDVDAAAYAVVDARLFVGGMAGRVGALRCYSLQGQHIATTPTTSAAGTSSASSVSAAAAVAVEGKESPIGRSKLLTLLFEYEDPRVGDISSIAYLNANNIFAASRNSRKIAIVNPREKEGLSPVLATEFENRTQALGCDGLATVSGEALAVSSAGDEQTIVWALDNRGHISPKYRLPDSGHIMVSTSPYIVMRSFDATDSWVRIFDINYNQVMIWSPHPKMGLSTFHHIPGGNFLVSTPSQAAVSKDKGREVGDGAD